MDIRNYGTNWKRFSFQNLKDKHDYGFVFPELYNFDVVLAGYLYSRLMMYKERTVADLTQTPVKVDGEETTLDVALGRVIEACRAYLADGGQTVEDEDAITKRYQYGIHILADIVPRIWN